MRIYLFWSEGPIYIVTVFLIFCFVGWLIGSCIRFLRQYTQQWQYVGIVCICLEGTVALGFILVQLVVLLLIHCYLCQDSDLMWSHLWRIYFPTCTFKYGLPMYWWCSVWISYRSLRIVVTPFLYTFCSFLLFLSVVFLWSSQRGRGPLVFWCVLCLESDIMSCHPFPYILLAH